MLAEQAAWAGVQAQTSPSVTASETNGVVTIPNTGSAAVNVPVTVPPGTTVSGGPSPVLRRGAVELDERGRRRQPRP